MSDSAARILGPGSNPLPYVTPTGYQYEVSLVLRDLCDCSKPGGKHARKCLTGALLGARLTDALLAHDRRLLRAHGWMGRRRA